MDDQTAVRTRRTALFLDFDNVYSGLRTMDSKAAESFARDPSRWLGWLEAGSDDGGTFRRRFLVRSCYLNPSVFSKFRSFFTSSGFKVIDCPSLTRAGKSSADIQMVLDVVDSLSHSTRYDEYMICSADADFAPLMTRIRAHDRLTTMVAAGPAATAYSSVCDHVIAPWQLAEQLLSAADGANRGEASAPQLSQPANSRDIAVPAAASPSVQPEARSAVELGDILAAVRAAVARASQPLHGAAAAQAAIRVDPGIAASGWAGSGNFAAFVGERLPELRFTRTTVGGWVFDPSRHSQRDAPVPLPEESLPAQVSRVANIPKLNSEQHAITFETLAPELVDGAYHLVGTPKVVRDHAAERGVPVPRSAVSAIVQGILSSGLAIASTRHTPMTLAHAWRDHVVQLCQAAQMELTDEDLLEIDNWVLGGLKA